MKIVYRLLIIIAALLVVFLALLFSCVFLLESFGPGIAAERIKVKTGFRLDIASLKLSLLNGSLKIEDLTLRNPEDWPEEQFLTVNHAVVDVEPGSLLGDGEKVIDEVVLDMGPINVVTNTDGQSNIGLLSAIGKSEKHARPAGGTTETKQERKTEKKTTPEFLIRHLVLKTSSVRYANYSGGSPVVREFPVKYALEMDNVSSIKQVRDKVMSQIQTSFLDKLLQSTQWNKASGADASE